MSSSKKKASSIILVICIIFLILGIVGCVLSSKIGAEETVMNFTKETWNTISMAFLNAGWVGALVVYWSNRRR